MKRDMTKWTTDELEAYVGGLSKPSKMPCHSYSIPATRCITGSKLVKIENSVCEGCYAMDGFYRFSNVQKALERRFKTLNKKRWVEVMAELISRKQKKVPYFRWHDSGDIQSVQHLENIAEVARRTPQIHHWIPTREYKIVKEWLAGDYSKVPSNLEIRMSVHMIGGHKPKGFKGLSISTVSKVEGTYPDAHECPSRFQDNKCGDCRACWNHEVKHVDYHYH